MEEVRQTAECHLNAVFHLHNWWWDPATLRSPVQHYTNWANGPPKKLMVPPKSCSTQCGARTHYHEIKHLMLYRLSSPGSHCALSCAHLARHIFLFSLCHFFLYLLHRVLFCQVFISPHITFPITHRSFFGHCYILSSGVFSQWILSLSSSSPTPFSTPPPPTSLCSVSISQSWRPGVSGWWTHLSAQQSAAVPGGTHTPFHACIEETQVYRHTLTSTHSGIHPQSVNLQLMSKTNPFLMPEASNYTFVNYLWGLVHIISHMQRNAQTPIIVNIL